VSLDAFTAHLIAQHDGRAVISVTEAAKVAGIGREHAYSLAGERRFPVFGTASAAATRESLQVLIPALVAWMMAGGTTQYDDAPRKRTVPARGRNRRAELDRRNALARQLACAR
jgi:hypothetical protein